MPRACDACGEVFESLSALRGHDCPERPDRFTIRVQARLITTESRWYSDVHGEANLTVDLSVFPDFDLLVERGESVPVTSVREQVGEALDDFFRDEHGLWDWAETVSEADVRAAVPEGRDVTAFKHVGSVEVTEAGDIEDTFVTLDELKAAVRT
jgi:predicted  nucleic acid-binding Zn-ribbon protein